MNHSPSIFVVVAVYNTSKYLETCLDSICNQTLRDIEIIVVNGGITDQSLIILTRYALKDKRIKIINQQNMGCSIARNEGFKIAKGEYISYIDSDDHILPNGLEKMLKIGRDNNLDIVLPIWRTTKNDKKLYEVKSGIQYLIEKLKIRDHFIMQRE